MFYDFLFNDFLTVYTIPSSSAGRIEKLNRPLFDPIRYKVDSLLTGLVFFVLIFADEVVHEVQYGGNILTAAKKKNGRRMEVNVVVLIETTGAAVTVCVRVCARVHACVLLRLQGSRDGGSGGARTLCCRHQLTEHTHTCRYTQDENAEKSENVFSYIL